MAEFVSDLYVAEGYATTGYVSDTYVNIGYVQGAILGEASLSVSASVTAQADRLKQTSATLTSTATTTTTPQKVNGGSATISSALSFSLEASQIKRSATLQASAGTLTATAVQTKRSTSTISANATQTAVGVQTKQGSSSISGAGALVVAAGRIHPGASLIANSGTLTADADVIRDGVVSMDVNAHDGVTWANYGTWNHDTQQIWGPTLLVSDIDIFLSGEATLTASATLSASAVQTKQGISLEASSGTLTASAAKLHSTAVADLEAFNSVLALGTTSTDTTVTLSSEFSLTSNAIFQVSGVSTQTAQFTVTADGDVLRSGIVLQASSGTLTADADKINSGSATLNAHPKTDLQSIVDLTDFYTVNGRLQFVSSGVWRRAITIQSDADDNIIDTEVVNTHIFRLVLDPGIYTFGFEANIINEPLGFNDVYWYNVTDSKEIVRQEYTDTGDDVEADAVQKNVRFTQETTLEIRATGTYANLNIGTIEPFVKRTTTHLDTLGKRLRGVSSTLQASASLSADGFAEFKGTTNINSQFTTTCNAGVLLRSSVDMLAFNTVLSALTIYIIDPFRVYAVDSESRTLIIEQELRKFAVKPENRLNNIEQETRGFTVKSESRVLKPQTLTLTEQINPLDRREG